MGCQIEDKSPDAIDPCHHFFILPSISFLLRELLRYLRESLIKICCLGSYLLAIDLPTVLYITYVYTTCAIPLFWRRWYIYRINHHFTGGVFFIYYTLQITDLILGQMLPDPLGLWSFTWEAPKILCKISLLPGRVALLHFRPQASKMASSPDN